MSDLKISQLTADASPTTDDLVVLVNDPAGTPATRKATVGDLLALVPATAPAGADGDVQFNNAGAFGADTGVFTYAAGQLRITGPLPAFAETVMGVATFCADDNESWQGRVALANADGEGYGLDSIIYRGTSAAPSESTSTDSLHMLRAYGYDGTDENLLGELKLVQESNFGALVGGAITSNSIANPTVVTTTAAHGLVTGDTVVITGVITSSPTINGTHIATVTNPTTFTVPVNVTVGGTGGTFEVHEAPSSWRLTASTGHTADVTTWKFDGELQAAVFGEAATTNVIPTFVADVWGSSTPLFLSEVNDYVAIVSFGAVDNGRDEGIVHYMYNGAIGAETKTVDGDIYYPWDVFAWDESVAQDIAYGQVQQAGAWPNASSLYEIHAIDTSQNDVFWRFDGATGALHSEVALLTPVAYASLPTPAEGMMAWVNNSNTATWGATIAGGGANKVLAVYNGTNWTVAGK